MSGFTEELPTANAHFKLYYYAAVLLVIDRMLQMCESSESPFEQFPFLTGYINELAASGLKGITVDEAMPCWRDQLQEWESRATTFLPIRALRDAAGLSYDALVAYFCLGLGEEDPRFGTLFKTVQGQHHLTYGLLNTWTCQLGDIQPRTMLRQWQDARLVHVLNPDAARGDWAL